MVYFILRNKVTTKLVYTRNSNWMGNKCLGDYMIIQMDRLNHPLRLNMNDLASDKHETCQSKSFNFRVIQLEIVKSGLK